MSNIDSDYELIIVNRCQTIWQSNDYNSSWDGTFNKICNDGTYLKLKFYNKERRKMITIWVMFP